MQLSVAIQLCSLAQAQHCINTATLLPIGSVHGTAAVFPHTQSEWYRHAPQDSLVIIINVMLKPIFSFVRLTSKLQHLDTPLKKVCAGFERQPENPS